ncbi:unnamed protein product [Bubo scandiacus]
MLVFSETISCHLFQPQGTSNSCNIWCVGHLYLMGLCLIFHWLVETFREGSNVSLEDWTFVQTYISVISFHENCHEQSIFVFRNEENRAHG